MKLIDIVDSTPIPFGYRISFLTNFFREPVLRRMEKEFDLIRPELTVLICLQFSATCTSKDICEITEQPSNTVSRAVGSLEKRGVITREADKNDARRHVLRLTENGTKLYHQVMELFVEAEAKLVECLSVEERGQLDTILGKLCRAVPDWKT